ncbi:lytic murein transglycosylase B [Castellaniella hirudinis]|uniref:lytic murein transglycosylase B n=1 Tax=Castellaniella hirudinis TaxID=1144617 RepID=UPI0039C36F08
MFRPTRFLQVAVASFFLSGCASSSDQSSHRMLDADKAQNQTIVSNERINSSRTQIPGQAATPMGDFVNAQGALLPEIHQFARETAAAQRLPLDQVEALLRSARYNAAAARLMAPPSHGGRIRRAWESYRKRHVDPIRIRRGVAFWQAHRATLDQVSAQTGVPPSILVAIIGIETVYGQFTGNHRVLDTLATLGFRYPDPNRPERQAMFRQQLADLIVLHQQGRLDAYTVEGSFAGAMGLPQFMPGSLMRYAADGNGDGRIDLARSIDDAIASVGRFLQLHGWVPGVPVFAPVSLPAQVGPLLQDGLAPTTDWTRLKAAGARALPGGGTRWETQPLGVIDLRDEIRGTHDYRTVTPNFFAITHYNRSYFYAASVAELAREIARQTGYGGPDRFD